MQVAKPWGRACRRQWLVAALVVAGLAGGDLAAQVPGFEVAASSAPEVPAPLPEVTVKARRDAPAAVVDPVRSISRVGADQIEQRQAASLFGLVDEVPGVAINGGPRASGMSLNIRGYTSNEDVQVRIDGVDKSFEKYRFGGTFVEPDLLKSLEVRRGAHIESGAGALGGTVSVTTQDAADLLRPGQRWGARVKVGHQWNNDEGSRMVAVYGRPTDELDLLVARSQRRSDDFERPDGSPILLSAVDAGSDLFKASWFPRDGWQVTGSWLRYQDQALSAYDATGGDPGLFGQVQRRIQDETASLQLRWSDASLGHRFKATLGRSTTRVRDHFEPWMKSFVSNARTGMVDDDIHYQGHSLDVQGTWRVLHDIQQVLDLHLGGQLSRSERDATRHQEVVTDRYPDGFNPSQPPGDKATQGMFVQADWRWRGWQVLPGVRWDRVSLQARGGTLPLLAAAGQAHEVNYSNASPSLTLVRELVPAQWTLSAQVARAFRPPLIDEVFMQGAYGRCLDAVLKQGVSGYTSQQKVAPSSGICGDLYRLERSLSREVALSTTQSDGWGAGTRLEARLTAFDNDTEDLLESLQAEPGGSGRLIQPGRETRHGLELESTASGPISWAWSAVSGARWRAHVGYTHLRGTYSNGQQTRALTTAPGRTLTWSLGWTKGAWSTSLRGQTVSDRTVLLREAASGDVLGIQPGYRVLAWSLQWRVHEHLNAQLVAENLENRTYRLNDGSGAGLGAEAPGRQIRLSLTGRY